MQSTGIFLVPCMCMAIVVRGTVGRTSVFDRRTFPVLCLECEVLQKAPYINTLTFTYLLPFTRSSSQH